MRIRIFRATFRTLFCYLEEILTTAGLAMRWVFILYGEKSQKWGNHMYISRFKQCYCNGEGDRLSGPQIQFSIEHFLAC